MGWLDLHGQTQILLIFYIIALLSLYNGYNLRSSFLFQLLVSFCSTIWTSPPTYKIAKEDFVEMIDPMGDVGVIFANIT
mgnify:CR=1 FL=1